MTELKIIDQEELKDWAKRDIPKKTLLTWLMFHQKKKLFVEPLASRKNLRREKKFLI